MLFAGVPFGQPPNAPGATPTWTTADVWPVDPSWVDGGTDGGATMSPLGSIVTFSSPYISDGVFVNGAPLDEVTLMLPLSPAFGKFPLILPIRHAVITFEHPADGGAGNVSGGIIAGVIDVQQLVASVREFAGSAGGAWCASALLDQLVQTILQAPDILLDGTNQPGVPCDAISIGIGIGFDADEIAPPSVVGTPAPIATPRVDAASEDAGDDAGEGGGD